MLQLKEYLKTQKQIRKGKIEMSSELWNFTQLIIWIIGIQTTFLSGLIWIVWTSLGNRIDKLDEKITDIDRRLCRLEGAFSSKDCCMIKDHRIDHIKHVE